MATPGGQKVESELGLVSPNTSVWQDGFIKGSPLTLPNIKSTSSAKICMTQIGSLETSFLQQRVGEVGMAEVSLSEGSLQTTNPLQISPLQITSAQDSFNQGSPSQVGLTQVCSLQNGTIELSTLQVGFSQNNSLQSLPTKVGTSQIDPGEVALPSSVSVKHFTDIHNPTSNLIALNSTAVSLWQNFHPNFDLTLQVTDLPTGQNIDFFSNFSTDIQRILKRRIDGGRVALLVDDSAWSFGSFNSTPITNNFSTRENSVSVNAINKSSLIDTSISHVSTDQNCAVDNSIIQDRVNQTGVFQGGSAQSSVTQIGRFNACTNQESEVQLSIAQVGTTQISIEQIGFQKVTLPQVSVPHVDIAQASTEKVTLLQVNSLQIGSFHVSLGKIDTSQVQPTQIRIGQFGSCEIPLTSSISLQQFLGSHNYTSQNTTVPTWLSFLTNTTPFNLTLDIRDLPTGQLAVACWR
jgi:hypothetical protein